MATSLPALSHNKACKQSDNDMDFRSCAGFIAKLKSVLDSATGDPPPGITVGEVEHRIVLLQGALDEVKLKNLELTKQRDLEEQQRYLKSVQKLLQQEEEIQAKQAKDNKAKLQAVQQAKEEAVLYFRDKNEKKEERTLKCREHTAKAAEDIVLRASSNEERRVRNLENLYSERERKRMEAMKRAEKKQEYARNVLKARAQMEEQKRVEMEEKVRLHDQEIEAKLEMIRNSRKSKWQDKGQRSRAKSIVVWENGEAILETQQKDHDDLVKELREREKAQLERYAGEKAERDFYLSQQRQLREEREKRVNSNLLRLANTRLKSGEEIKVNTVKKYEKADKAYHVKEQKQHEAGEQLQRTLAEHQLRAERLNQERRNKALASNFQRWNFRAARIVTELRAAMEEKEKADEEDDDPWRNTSSRSVQPEPEKRPIRLPSPTDFKC